MKKLLFGMLAVVLLSMMVGTVASCTGCGTKEKVLPVVPDGYDGVAVDFTAGAEHITALHKQTMFTLYDGENYVWYEQRVLLSDSIRQDNLDSLKVTDVTNVFQLFDPFRCQTISSDIEKGTIIPKPVYDVWIEDCEMNDAEIKLTINDVMNRLKAWDGILPPGNSITLRIPLGPKRCNAQYVIGHIYDVIFIDAVTGDITDWCPAFPRPDEFAHDSL